MFTPVFLVTTAARQHEPTASNVRLFTPTNIAGTVDHVIRLIEEYPWGGRTEYVEAAIRDVAIFYVKELEYPLGKSGLPGILQKFPMTVSEAAIHMETHKGQQQIRWAVTSYLSNFVVHTLNMDLSHCSKSKEDVRNNYQEEFLDFCIGESESQGDSVLDNAVYALVKNGVFLGFFSSSAALDDFVKDNEIPLPYQALEYGVGEFYKQEKRDSTNDDEHSV
jgi:hypothetical protein